MRVTVVAGARPNFMKIAPILRAIDKRNASARGSIIEPLIVHTGQHYDYEMSEVFFEDLELPEPAMYLGVGSGTHAEQTGKVMLEFEKVLIEQKPNLVVVVGDVNSTLAGALAAVKLHIPVAPTWHTSQSCGKIKNLINIYDKSWNGFMAFFVCNSWLCSLQPAAQTRFSPNHQGAKSLEKCLAA